jgi:sugar-phosphatase
MTLVSRRFRVSAVLLDLDGVMVHSAGAIERAWRTWAATYGLAWETVRPHLHGRRAVDIIRELSGGLSVAEAQRQARELMRGQVSDTSELVAVAGIPELVAELPGPQWAVVTACSRELATARLRAVGYPIPEVLVTADDGIPGKPDPGGYRLAAERLGLSAGPCLVLEDSVAGVAAGKAAGMAVIGLLTTHDRAALAVADATVPDGRWLSTTVINGDILVDQLSSPGIRKEAAGPRAGLGD